VKQEAHPDHLVDRHLAQEQAQEQEQDQEAHPGHLADRPLAQGQEREQEQVIRMVLLVGLVLSHHGTGQMLKQLAQVVVQVRRQAGKRQEKRHGRKKRSGEKPRRPRGRGKKRRRNGSGNEKKKREKD